MSILELLQQPSLIVSGGRYSGLGNRMRAVLGGQSLAEIEGRAYFYCWPTSRRFGAAMTDLWHYEPLTVPRVITRVLAARYPMRDASLTWVDGARSARTWQIRSGQPLALPEQAVPWMERLRQLRPTDEIADRVREVFDSRLRGRPYIGVMVRAHRYSHEQTREMSPISWFTDRMREIRQSCPEIGFYVSSDVAEVQEQIVAAFDDTYGLPGKGTYNSAASIKAAVVDLYLLASSIHILGPHYSSFPEMAAHLAGDQVALETSVAACDFLTRRSRWTLVDDPTRPSVRAQR